MKIDYLLLTACLMVGVGIGTAIVKKNILSITISFSFAILGLILIASTIEKEIIFSFSLMLILSANLILGCSITYRKLISHKTTNIDDKNELRH